MTERHLADKIRFLHIPKTAGSSFDECIFILYLKSYLLRQRFTFTGNLDADRRRYNQLSSNKRKHTAIYTGHAPRITGIDEIDCVPTITLLRNPIDRVISFCQHVSEGKSINLLQGFDHKKMDVDKFLSSGRTQLSNFQSKLLLGKEDYILPKGNTETLVDRTLYVLEHELSCFGITEEFDRSLILFKHTLGWKKHPIYRRRNIKDNKCLISFEARHIKKIEELNQIDMQVYDRASALFSERIHAQSERIADELIKFQQQLDKQHVIFPAIDLVRWLKRLVTQSKTQC